MQTITIDELRAFLRGQNIDNGIVELIVSGAMPYAFEGNGNIPYEKVQTLLQRHAPDAEIVDIPIAEAQTVIEETQDRERREREAAQATIHSVAQKQVYGQQLTPEEEELAAENPEEVSSLMSLLAMNQSPQIGWIFQGDAGLMGMSSANVDYASMWDMTREVFGYIPGVEFVDGMEYEDWKAMSMQALLATGPNELNSAIVQLYADSTGHSGNDWMMGKHKVMDVARVSEQYSLTMTQAKGLGDLGTPHDMSIDESARFWDIMERNGVATPLSLFDSDKPKADFFRLNEDPRERVSGYAGEVRPNVDARGTDYDKYMRYQTGRRAYDTMAEYNAAKAKYGSELLGTVAVIQPDLAQRLYDDPYTLTVEELKTVEGIVGAPSQYTSTTDVAGANWIQQRLLGGQETIKVDKSGAAEAARTLASSWNLPGLSDRQVNSIVNAVVGPQVAAAKAALGNPFNPTLHNGPRVVNAPSPYAAAAGKLRGSAAYKELFGNLQDGESEEGYAARFDSESQEMLGDKNLEAVRAGMRSGSRNTVGQSALMSGAGSDSSTFRGRLANLGKAFKGST